MQSALGLRRMTKRLLRALRDARSLGPRAFRPDAQVGLRPKSERVPLGLDVHAVVANLDATAARLAGGQTVNLVFAEGVAVPVWRRADFPLDLLLCPICHDRTCVFST